MKKQIIVLLSVLFLASCSVEKYLIVEISNSLPIHREDEIVEIDKQSIWAKLKLTENDKIILLNKDNKQIPYQFAKNFNSDSREILIFPATVKSNAKSVYKLKRGTPESFEQKVNGRLVPERKDDFNWENDKVAFRMYGPALQATGEISGGIDIWAKRTNKLVADKWYADELSGKSSYHTDNGEGLDFYKVGPTLGAGAAAPFLNEKLWLSKNFINYEIIENGPLRITFRLKYDGEKIDEIGDVTGTRLISLDAGSQLNKIRQSYEFKTEKLPVAAGIVLRNSPDEQVSISSKKDFAAHAEPADKTNGILFEGLVSTSKFENIEKKSDHLLCIQTLKPLEEFTYYAGAGWSKFGYPTFEDWIKYLEEFSQKVQSPLTVSIK